MNRLQIVQRLRQEAGVSGSGPSTLSNLSGELKRLSDYADDAWLEIQGLALWDWRWVRTTLTLPPGESLVSCGFPQHQLATDSMRMRPTGRPLNFLAWRDFIDTFPQSPPASEPSYWTVRPDRKVQFNGQAPTGGLVFDFEAYSNPTTLGSDAAVPSLPPEYHMAIVWLALQKYALSEEAGALYQTAEREYQKLKRQMERTSTQEISIGGGLC